MDDDDDDDDGVVVDGDVTADGIDGDTPVTDDGCVDDCPDKSLVNGVGGITTAVERLLVLSDEDCSIDTTIRGRGGDGGVGGRMDC